MLTSRSNRRKRRNARGASEIAEFIPALFVLFIIILMPLIDLAAVFVAAATQYLATNDIVSKAATQADYASALSSMASEAYNFQSTGFAKFVKLQPLNGFTGCGDDLYVLATDVGSGTVVTSSANQPLAQNIDSKTNIYELSVRSEYTTGPLISLSGVPLLADIPGLGKPATLVFTANRPVEHPGGLQATNNPNGGGQVQPFQRVAYNPPAGGGGGTPPAEVWRNPDIFAQIKNAGQKVISINVVIVPANVGVGKDGWIPAGINIQAGQTVWLDTQAQGKWGWTGYSDTDANGSDGPAVQGPAAGDNSAKVSADYPAYMLLGYVGNPPPMMYQHSGTQISGDPNFIPSGNTLVNYPISTGGPISLICNDNQDGNHGEQYVRIIVTQ